MGGGAGYYLRVKRALNVARRNEAFLHHASGHHAANARPAIALVELDHVKLLVLGHRDAAFTGGCWKAKSSSLLQIFQSVKLTIEWIKRFACSERLDRLGVVIHVLVDVLVIRASLA